MHNQSTSHTTAHRIIVEPTKGWRPVNLSELIKYRELFFFLVLRDIKVLYKQTALGYAWAVIRPVMSMIAFSVIFGRLAKMPSDGVPYPIFAYAALVPWTYFATAVTKSSESLIAYAHVFTKVYFPRIAIPMTPVLAGLVDFLLAFVVLILMMIWYGIVPSLNCLWLPALVFIMILTAAGMGMWLSAMAVQYRDIKHAAPFLSQFLMYVAPVVWPASLVPAKFRLLYGLYPMAGVIEGFRSALTGSTPMPWDLISIGAASGALLALSGAIYFTHVESVFADVA